MMSADRQPVGIGIVLIDDFALLSFSSFAEPFRAANLLAGRELFQLDLISTHRGHVACSLGPGFECRHYPEVINNHEYLFVVAGGNPAEFLDDGLFDWLHVRAGQGCIMGGISGGPVILVMADLMAGYRMTVHWHHIDLVAEMSLDVHIERSLYVMDRDRITCAGGSAPLDLAHAIIANHQGSNLAHRVSDWFMHTDVRLPAAAQRSGLVERYRTNCRPVIEAIGIMETHISDPLTLTQVAMLSGVGSHQLIRLFKAEIGHTPMSFYRSVRLKKAELMLQTSTFTIGQVARATGFNDVAHLSRSVRMARGMSPLELRRRTRGEQSPVGLDFN